MIWTVAYGKGRVCENVLGHDVEAMKSAGFRTLLIRGVEWAATGAANHPLPAELKAKAKGETVAERAKWFAQVRDAEGYMAELITNEKDGGPQILECHSPVLNVLERYPIIGRFEQDMFEGVLGTRVRREVTRNSGLYECAFYFQA